MARPIASSMLLTCSFMSSRWSEAAFGIAVVPPPRPGHRRRRKAVDAGSGSLHPIVSSVDAIKSRSRPGSSARASTILRTARTLLSTSGAEPLATEARLYRHDEQGVSK